MTTVTVNQAQAETMVKTGELVEVRDPAGAVIGFFAPVKLEYAKDYAEAAARAQSIWGRPDGRPAKQWYTGEEVAAHLRSLEEKQ